MLTNGLKENLKNNDLFSVDIHEIAKGLMINKNQTDIIKNSYINELKKYIEEYTNINISIIENISVKEVILNNKDSYISITEENKSINIIFSAYMSIRYERDDTFDFEKILSISTDKYASSLFYFIFKLSDKEEEIDYFDYEFESFKRSKEDNINMSSEEGIEIISNIAEEICLKGKICEDFFDIISLSSDMDYSDLKKVFYPVFNVNKDKNIELKNLLKKINKNNISNKI